MKVALTGAGGFIGSAILRHFLNKGIDVAAHAGPVGVNTPLNDVPVRAFDICDVEELRKLVSGCNLVVHAAGPPSVADSVERPRYFVQAHVLGTACVVEAMRSAGVGSIVYISSAEVYGSPQAPAIKEDQRLAPRSPYGASKAAAELLLQTAAPTYGFGGYILRPFSVYGRGMSPASLLESILSQADRQDEIAVHDLSPVRDYCFVDDLAELVVSAALNPRKGFTVLNAAFGKGYSVGEVIAAAAAATGRPLRSIELGPQRPREMEIRRLVADVEAARQELGWRARHDLEEGIRAMRSSADL